MPPIEPRQFLQNIKKYRKVAESRIRANAKLANQPLPKLPAALRTIFLRQSAHHFDGSCSFNAMADMQTVREILRRIPKDKRPENFYEIHRLVNRMHFIIKQEIAFIESAGDYANNSVVRIRLEGIHRRMITTHVRFMKDIDTYKKYFRDPLKEEYFLRKFPQDLLTLQERIENREATLQDFKRVFDIFREIFYYYKEHCYRLLSQ